MRGTFITVAPNGAWRSSTDPVRTPLTPGAIASCAEACRDAGAAMMHMHVRDASGRHSLNPALYKEVTEMIRGRIGNSMIIQISTESAGRYKPYDQMQCIRVLRPESASISIRELGPPRHPKRAYIEFIRECADRGVWLQHIFYSPEEILEFSRLQRMGALPTGTLSALAVVGDRHGIGPTSHDALVALSSAAAQIENCIWSACAFGKAEAEVLLSAAKSGWHVRTGFENTLHLFNGRIALDNAELVRQYASALRKPDCEIIDAGQVRVMFNLTPPERRFNTDE